MVTASCPFKVSFTALNFLRAGAAGAAPSRKKAPELIPAVSSAKICQWFGESGFTAAPLEGLRSGNATLCRNAKAHLHFVMVDHNASGGTEGAGVEFRRFAH